MSVMINDSNKEQSSSTYDVDTILDEMAKKLHDKIHYDKLESPVMVGIHSAGVWIAQCLHKSLGIIEPLGELNISFYRDDFSQIGLHPQIKPSKLPFSIENKHIILVDDVLYTGRTTRAAMNELFDFGRPASITLAVLIDRGRRELPVEAQIVGFKQEMEAENYFKLINDNNKLELKIINRENL